MQPAVTQDEALYWLALRMTPGLGTRKAGQLLEVFRSPQAIFRASRSELQAAGLAASVAQSLASGCAFDDAADQQTQAAKAGAVLIPVTDARYPPALRDIFDPPPLLFARGRVELLATLMIGVVGTRRPTAYGTVVATKGGTSVSGTWTHAPAITYYGSSSKESIVLNLGTASPFAMLTKTWNVVSSTTTTLTLVSPEVLEDMHLVFSRE